MPIYEYVCNTCGNQIDVLQKVSEPAPAKCEKCGAANPFSRKVSRTSFVLKGGGWYSDLYSSTKKGSGGGGRGGSSSSGSSSSGGGSTSSGGGTAAAAAPSK